MSLPLAADRRYDRTVRACFFCYIVQATVINFYPLLFLTFQKEFDISLALISLLIGINFGTQLLTDIVAMSFIKKISYRTGMVMANATAAVGLISLAFLPRLLPIPYLGILISVIVASVGGGLIEVFVSPLVEACPSSNKSAAMSLLHSFYCWGHAGVILLSIGFFALFGIENYRFLAILFGLLPLALVFVFWHLPIPDAAVEASEHALPMRKLLSCRFLPLFFLLMLMGGAAEQCMAQWASAFVEQSLGLPKALGDLLGPTVFALCMGVMRMLYGLFGERMRLRRTIALSAFFCAVGYLLAALSPHPALSLVGCALTGFSCGIFWPGTLSSAAQEIPMGGPLMFTLLAIGGDIGCLSGPAIGGLISAAFGDDLRMGLLFMAAMPALLFLLYVLALRPRKRDGKND